MLRRALVVSLLVHVALLLGVQLWPRRPGHAPDPSDSVVELEIAPPSPVPAAAAGEGTRLDAPATVAEPTPGRRTNPRERRSRAADPKPAVTPRPPAAPDEQTQEQLPAQGSLLRMRGPDLALHDDAVTVPAPPATPPPGPVVPLGPVAAAPARPVRPELHRDQDGFEASVQPDGQVRIEDHAPVRLGDQLSRRKLRDWWDDPEKHRRGDEPTVGRFDVGDIAMRLAGQDPYRAEKQKFLDATRDERIAMARAAAPRQEERALAELSTRLQTIWRSTAPARMRRQLLFELWDECTEGGPDSDVASVSGERARAAIVRFIRRELPDGSADAYPTTELAALNRGRTSRRAFAPYQVTSGAASR